jgi:hypothetical protein
VHVGTAIEVAVHRVDVEAMGAVRSGAPVQVRWARPFDAAYITDTVVQATMLVDGEHRLVLRWPTRVERQQSRIHVRAPLTAAVALAGAGPRRIGGSGGGWVHGTVIDVSGGGLGLVTGQSFEIGHIVLVRYDVPGRDHDVSVEARARITRREAVPSRNGLIRYGIELLDTPARVEQGLVQAVFHLMRTRVEPLS